MNLNSMKNMFEESFYPAAYPLWGSDGLGNIQFISAMVSLSPRFFMTDMRKEKVIFQVNTTQSVSRDVVALKTKILSLREQPESGQSPCYWLGFLAREAEKLGLPLDDYWQTCSIEGIDEEAMSRILQ